MRWSEWRAVADDPSKWTGRWERGLLKVEYVTDYTLRLWFEEELDVSIYELDFRPLLIEDDPGVVFQSLRDKKTIPYGSSGLRLGVAKSRDRRTG